MSFKGLRLLSLSVIAGRPSPASLYAGSMCVPSLPTSPSLLALRLLRDCGDFSPSSLTAVLDELQRHRRQEEGLREQKRESVGYSGD